VRCTCADKLCRLQRMPTRRPMLSPPQQAQPQPNHPAPQPLPEPLS
jgi:hypothetical protein